MYQEGDSKNFTPGFHSELPRPREKLHNKYTVIVAALHGLLKSSVFCNHKRSSTYIYNHHSDQSETLLLLLPFGVGGGGCGELRLQRCPRRSKTYSLSSRDWTHFGALEKYGSLCASATHSALSTWALGTVLTCAHSEACVWPLVNLSRRYVDDVIRE